MTIPAAPPGGHIDPRDMTKAALHEAFPADDNSAPSPVEGAKILRLPTRLRPEETSPQDFGRLWIMFHWPLTTIRGLLKFPFHLLSRLFHRRHQVRGHTSRELIISAMHAHAELRLRYEGHFGYLDVEPHALYRDDAGRLILLCYELPHPEERETDEGWHHLVVADVVAAFPSGHHFSPRNLPDGLGPKTLLNQIAGADNDR